MKHAIVIYAMLGFCWLAYLSAHRPVHHNYTAAYHNHLLDSVIQVESGGNAQAISPKGARGIAQIMPATAKKPGFGITPLRNKTVKEQRRFANDYLNAMLKRYNNIKLALAAYNCGPKCADSGNLPQETREYINKVLAQ